MRDGCTVEGQVVREQGGEGSASGRQADGQARTRRQAGSRAGRGSASGRQSDGRRTREEGRGLSRDWVTELGLENSDRTDTNWVVANDELAPAGWRSPAEVGSGDR